MDALVSDLTDSILRCAIAVHRELGPGLPEHSYQTALTLELDAAGLRYISDRPIIVRYRGVVVGWHRPDFIVEDRVIVELKAASKLRFLPLEASVDLPEDHEAARCPTPEFWRFFPEKRGDQASTALANVIPCFCGSVIL
jgi:GxxExxY protein